MYMSTVHFLKTAALCVAMLISVSPAASAESLKPFKDELFSYHDILETADGGDYRVVGYDEMRDINVRDQIPERRVKSAYVSTAVKRQQVNETLPLGDTGIDVTRVGQETNAAFTVIFIHGRGGDRRLGANDYSFGGNFNRIKNLAVTNGGSYYAPSVASFDAQGVARIAGLIAIVQERSPGRPVILSCASMGSFICWGITRQQETVTQLAGMMLMGGAFDPDFSKSAAFKAKLPMFFSHGSRDSVYPAERQVSLYKALKAGGYPARFVLFDSGSHGTPVRMTDWRDALNWLLSIN